MKKLELGVLGDMDQSVGFGLLRGELGDEFGGSHTHGCWELKLGPQRFADCLPYLCRRFVVMSETGRVKKRFVKTQTLHKRGE